LKAVKVAKLAKTQATLAKVNLPKNVRVHLARAALPPNIVTQSQDGNEETEDEDLTAVEKKRKAKGTKSKNKKSKKILKNVNLPESANERQLELLRQKQLKEKETQESATRIRVNQGLHREWVQEGQDWARSPKKLLAGVAKELRLGPGKQVLEDLDGLQKLMMQEDKHSDNVEKALATLNNCFPVTRETGEKKDKSVTEISHLKYIPTHNESSSTICRHVYQGRVESGCVDGVVDLLNPSWVRWCDRGLTGCTNKRLRGSLTKLGQERLEFNLVRSMM
jgi:hypothetical protein